MADFDEPLDDPVTHIRFTRDGDEVQARGGGEAAASVLQHAGFVPEYEYTPDGLADYHRLPAGMTDVAEQRACVSRAATRLRQCQYDVHLAAEFGFASEEQEWKPPDPSHDRLVLRASQITGPDEVVRVMTEISAPHNGTLFQNRRALEWLADYCDGLGTRADALTAERLRHHATRLRDIQGDLSNIRTAVADRAADHRQRSAGTDAEPRTARAEAATSRVRHGPRPDADAATTNPAAQPAQPSRVRHGPHRS